ncbi:MAG: Gfo/Idh/MocA family oxidoreductase [Pseudomonadota bacterium]
MLTGRHDCFARRPGGAAVSEKRKNGTDMSSEFEALRVGLIGCGGMGVRHARAVAEMHQRGCRAVEIVAVCDLDAARRAPIVAMIHEACGKAPAEYETLAALLDDPGVEAVDIVLPTSLHHTAILAALEAGKHVQVEKPLALTVSACDLIVAAAARANRVVAVAENYRRIASNRAIGGLIRAGAFGPLDAMFVRNLASPEPPVQPGGKPVESPLWYRDRTRAGGYHVLEMGVHEADLQHFWFGPVKTVQASTHLFARDRAG